MIEAAQRRWADALAAMRLVRGAGLSLIVRARAGPVRDALMAELGPHMLKITADSDVASLVGGVDMLESLSAGQSVRADRLIDRLDGRALVVAGAERLSPALCALIATLIDQGEIAGLVLIDEGIDDETVPAMIADRIAMLVDLDGLSIRDAASLEPDEDGDAPPPVPTDMTEAICAAATALGIASLRAPLAALSVARVQADLDGREIAGTGAYLFAARVCLAPRAMRLPPANEDAGEPEHEDQDIDDPADAQSDSSDEDRELIVEAARVAIPPGLLDLIAIGAGRSATTSGSAVARRGSGARGRAGRAVKGLPRRGGRLDLVATLIAAAPMQRLRGRAAVEGLAVRRDDIRVRVPKPKQRAATIFAVDASGSAAVARLAEVKGAVEQLLAQSYVRRDEVGLIAFRGEAAETLLPPTRSLARAKRELAALPGGGPTPLADGIIAGLDQAIRCRAAGRSPLLLLLTDGGANVARDGSKGREQARADAEDAARSVAAAKISALVIDSSPRGEAKVRALAEAMAARYVALPRLDDRALAGIVAAAR